MSCGSGTTAPSGTHALRPAGLVYRPSCLEQRTHCVCLSGAVERRGTVPPGQEGRVAPWGPSHQWADSSLRLHTFATVMGLTLVSLVHLTLGTRKSATKMMKSLAEVKATLVRVRSKERGRRATVMLAPDLSAEQRKSVKSFELGRWMPILLSSRSASASTPDKQPAT